MKFNSIRFKTSIFFTSVLCLVLVLYSSALLFYMRHELYKDVDQTLRIKVDQVSGMLNAYAGLRTQPSHPNSIMDQFLMNPLVEISKRKLINNLWKTAIQSLNLEKDYMRVIDETGAVLLFSSNISTEFRQLGPTTLTMDMQRTQYTDIKIGGKAYRIISAPFLYNNSVPLLIQLATPLTPVDHVLERLIFYITAGIIAVLILTSFLGNLLTRRILRPVALVSQLAERMSHKELGMRIEEKAVDTEMRLLTESFNTMLERLETSFAHINEFSSHVAHELKTPLAIIKGELELAESEERDPKEYRRVIRTALEEIERMIRTIKDLLLLAKLDYKPDIFDFQKADITHFLKDIHEHSRILGAEKNITLGLDLPEQEILVEYDPVHLRRLFFNIIHNAIKFTPEGGTIDIAVKSTKESVQVSVQDSGPGIPTEALDKIFEKFFRIQKGDAPDSGGHGLGLSIAQSIARAHKGHITVESSVGAFSRFTVSLPRAPR